MDLLVRCYRLCGVVWYRTLRVKVRYCVPVSCCCSRRLCQCHRNLGDSHLLDQAVQDRFRRQVQDPHQFSAGHPARHWGEVVWIQVSWLTLNILVEGRGWGGVHPWWLKPSSPYTLIGCRFPSNLPIYLQTSCRPAYPTVFDCIRMKIGQQYRCTSIFLKIWTKSFQKV